MEDYIPVSCALYDQLEALATLHQPCRLSYRDASGEILSLEGLVVDVYASNGADYLKLRDGTEIRLDQLTSLNDQSLEQASSLAGESGG